MSSGHHGFLGRGSHGVVYDNMDCRSVTKCVSITMDSPDGYRYVRQDSIIEPCVLHRLRQCKVPYIVEMQGVGAVHNIVEMKLEKLYDVPQMLQNDEFARRLIAQLFIAVDGMHKVEVYHGDIKNHNVMLNRYNDLKVIDFSLAKMDVPIVSDRWEELYTITYRPPELLLGSNHFNRAKADVWAAGITACHMMLKEQQLMRSRYWREAMFDISQLFGRVPGELYPRWNAYMDTVRSFCDWDKYAEEENGFIYGRIEAVRGPKAADFIRKACCLDPNARWSAEKLLDHPYIKDLVPEGMIPYDLPTIHLFEKPKDRDKFTSIERLEQSIIAEALLEHIKTDPSTAIRRGARNICSIYKLDTVYSSEIDLSSMSILINTPETLEYLSNHIHVHALEDL